MFIFVTFLLRTFLLFVRAPLGGLRQLSARGSAHLLPEVDQDLLQGVGAAPVGKDVEVAWVDLFFLSFFPGFCRVFLA